MKLVYLIVALFVLLSLIYGEIYEYREVVFYPNGSQNVDISKLYINYENPESFNIYIYYGNISIYIPYPKNITINLPPKKFNLSITISANKISEREWEVYYKIINNYSYDILFNVSFPDGFNIKNISVLVPAHSYKIITLSKIDSSPTLYFGEHNISFEVPGKVKIRYSLPIPFSIIKSNRILSNGSIEWIAIYTIKNDKSVSLNVNVSYWAKVNNRKINFGNYTYILNPNENISESFNIISDEVPIFYLKLYAWRDIDENITIKPVLKVGNSYIIGLAKVEGINFTTSFSKKMNINKIPTKKKNTREKIRVINKEKIKSRSLKYNLKQKTSNTKTTSENKKMEIMKFPLVIVIDKKKVKDAIIVTTTTASTLMIIFIPPLFRRTPDIADNGIFTIEDLEKLHTTVYVPEGCELGNFLPGGIVIVELNEVEKDLARDLHEIYNIPLNSAKAIVLGIKYGGRVFLSDVKSQEIALKIGLEVYPFFNKKVK
ncbi:conserved protein of unknown function [Methanocaldococcus lauensis]|uniref:Uncharacterized protein n=1 Tax=Methanocaldococcus lauensis TaxID=2546128 RepID=A0A8D6PTL9_9EURY|nr:hypothetical protein [Methanocaldococcus lauensis]CAB3289907.1 conserved protein of unknown function [Methanocaldococcus lauensis]